MLHHRFLPLNYEGIIFHQYQSLQLGAHTIRRSLWKRYYLIWKQYHIFGKTNTKGDMVEAVKILHDK